MSRLVSALRASPMPLSRVSGLGVPWATLGSFALVTGTGFANGGYFAESWGLPTLIAAWAAAIVLATRDDASLGVAGAGAVGLLTAFVGWTVLSTLWSRDDTHAVLSAERTTLYVTAALAALLVARHHPEQLLYGAWAGSTVLCVWGLLTRLVPDRFGVTDAISGYRLSEPIGYWNSLGLLAAMGALLGLGLAARAPSLIARALGAASIPLFVTTLYFTFSRGAWVAFAIGLAAAIGLAPRRVQLLAVAIAVAPFVAVAVWRASVSSALTTAESPLLSSAHDGHRLILVLLGCSAFAAVSALAAGRFNPNVNLSARVRQAITAALIVIAVVVAVIGFGPAKRAWHTFATGNTSETSNLNSRIFQLGGNGRLPQWHVALDDAGAHPLVGSGAGSFQQQWFERRANTSRIRNAHNLYLETLAELGPLGLALLVGFLALPLVAAFRRRAQPLAFAAFGAYVAFVLHAAVDWDWQIASVSLVAVLLGAGFLTETRIRLSRAARSAALAGALVLGATGVYVFASRIPMTRLAKAEAHGNWGEAEKQAKRASAFAPWSEEPWLNLGEAELNAGRKPAARVFLLKAIAATPSDWTPWYDLARASTGDTRTTALARARALNPLEPELTP